MIRKIIHSILNVNASKGYDAYEVLESKQMVYDILQDPARFRDHIRRFANSLSTQIIYGTRTVSNDDESLKRLFEGFEKFSEAAASTLGAILDIYPIFRKLPAFMLPSLRYAQELHEQEKDLYLGHFTRAKERTLKGTSKVS